jgi:hypothetical protein
MSNGWNPPVSQIPTLQRYGVVAGSLAFGWQAAKWIDSRFNTSQHISDFLNRHVGPPPSWAVDLHTKLGISPLLGK